MSNGVTIHQQSTALTGTVSARALAYVQRLGGKASDELAGGITGGFGVLGFRGKVWRLKFQGEEKAIERQSPAGGFMEPVPSIPVVIIAATNHLTKTYYEAGYTEGSVAPPDCASADGIKPDVGVPKKQCELCAICPNNRFGSGKSADGQNRGKACADSKRLAVVPSADLMNSSMGGPMLLRIPAASLAGLQKYAGELERQGLPFFAVGTWLYFEGAEAYPKIMFSGERILSDDEFTIIENYRSSEQVKRILSSVEVPGEVAPTPQQQGMFSATPPGEAAPAAQPTPAPTPAPAPVVASAPEPVAQAETPDQMRARIMAEMQAEATAKAAQDKAAQEAADAARVEAERAAQAAAQPAPAPTESPAELEARLRRELMAELAAAQPASAPEPAPVAQAASTPAPVAQPAPSAPAPTPAPAAAPGVAAADGDFTQFLDSLTAGV